MSEEIETPNSEIRLLLAEKTVVMNNAWASLCDYVLYRAEDSESINEEFTVVRLPMLREPEVMYVLKYCQFMTYVNDLGVAGQEVERWTAKFGTMDGMMAIKVLQAAEMMGCAPLVDLVTAILDRETAELADEDLYDYVSRGRHLDEANRYVEETEETYTTITSLLP